MRLFFYPHGVGVRRSLTTINFRKLSHTAAPAYDSEMDATAVEDNGGDAPQKAGPSAPRPAVNGDGSADAPMEIVDGDDAEAESKPAVGVAAAAAAAAEPGQVAQQPAAPQPTFPGGYPIDVCFEASKLPLDVAIFNSARAAGGDDKIRKYLQAVLVIGGCALIPGMAHALESRCGDRCEWVSSILLLCSNASTPPQTPGHRDAPSA